MDQSLPNLAHVVPDSKTCLKDDEMIRFFTCNDVNLLQNKDIANNKPDLVVTSMMKDGIDAVYIDNVLSEGNVLCYLMNIYVSYISFTNVEECQHLRHCCDQSPSLSFWSNLGRDNEHARRFRDANTIEMESIELATLVYNRVAHALIGGRKKGCICPDVLSIQPPAEDVPLTAEKSSDAPEHAGAGGSQSAAEESLYSKDIEGNWVPYNLNSNLLFAVYPTGGAFAPHTDGRAIQDFNHRSFYSVIIYLNTIPVGGGGGTRFYKPSVLQHLLYWDTLQFYLS